MNEPRNIRQADDEQTLVAASEETLIAPRFDEEETLVARPVVPLESVDGDETPATITPVASVGEHAWRPRAPRRGWIIALVLVSALAGGVLGGAGLYFYQKRPSATAAAPAPPDAPAETPAPAEAAEAQPATEQEQPQQDASATTPGDAGEATTVPASETQDPGPEPEAAEPVRNHSDERDSDGAGATERRPKRGKKGARDEELRRRTESEGTLPRADSAPEARRVDTISYRPRRVNRDRPRRERQRPVNSIRGIFEGQP